MSFIFETRIRFVDTDASGRIHYTSMFRYFESAEDEFMRSIGYRHIGARTGPNYPRVHVECDYLKAIRYDDLIRIEVTVERVGGSSYTLGFSALLDGSAAARGKITVACMDPQTQRSRPLPENLSESLRQHFHSSKVEPPA